MTQNVVVFCKQASNIEHQTEFRRSSRMCLRSFTLSNVESGICEQNKPPEMAQSTYNKTFLMQKSEKSPRTVRMHVRWIYEHLSEMDKCHIVSLLDVRELVCVIPLHDLHLRRSCFVVVEKTVKRGRPPVLCYLCCEKKTSPTRQLRTS